MTSKSPKTRESLLLRVRDPRNADAWCEFVDVYAPLIHRYGRQRGLQDADAADLAQQVLQQISKSVAEFEYDAAKGTFRGWMFTITRNKLLRMVEKEQQHAKATGDTKIKLVLEQHADDSLEEDVWNALHEKRLFELAMTKARPEFKTSTWDAFQRTAIAGQKPQEVARELNVSLGAVYIAKSRVTSRLRQIVKGFEDSA